jgi:hypothetical protein
MAKFQPGQSGNPRGRPRRGQSFADALKTALAIKDPETKRTQLQRVASALVAQAASGNVTAIALIAERLDGKVATDLNLGGQNGEPLKLVIERVSG